MKKRSRNKTDVNISRSELIIGSRRHSLLPAILERVATPKRVLRTEEVAQEFRRPRLTRDVIKQPERLPQQRKIKYGPTTPFTFNSRTIPVQRPTKSNLCVARAERREVLFSLNIAGHAGRSPGRNGTYRRDDNSQYSCTKKRR